MSLAVLWNLIPSGLRNIFYAVAALAIAALAFEVQAKRIDSLKLQLAVAKDATAATAKALADTTASMNTAYAAANEATAALHAAEVQIVKTVYVTKEKIVHVYEKDPAVRAVMDMPLPADLLDGLCVSPGSCGYSVPAAPQAAPGVDRAAPASPAPPVNAPAVRDLIANREELLAWADEARARYTALVDFLRKTED